jgi:hypothetical protein
MKYKILKKNLFTTLIFLILFSLSFSIIENRRNLQNFDYVKFRVDSIYYKLEFIMNDITGSGNKLKDVPYKSLCITKNCPNICCIGDIDSMTCGSIEQCKTFYDAYIVGNVIESVIFPVFFVFIFLIFFYFFNKYSNNKPLSALLAFCCIFIITIPLVFCYIVKFKPFEKTEKNEYVFFLNLFSFILNF